MEKARLNLDGNGSGLTVFHGNDDVISQNNDIAVDFLGDALGAGFWKIQPNGVTHWSSTQSQE